MYLKHFQLSEIPFDISPNPKFLWMGEKYREALATLEYGILESKGFVLLTGDVGTGKTTLLNMLLNDLGAEVTAIKIPDPSFTKQEFYYYVAKRLQIKGRFTNKGVFLDAFAKILYKNHLNGRKTLLIVDEAQRLTHELAEEIRMLSNIEEDNIKLLTIIFAGQNELGDFLWQDENRALRQRITAQYAISQLSKLETMQYIETRLRIAGANHEIFDSGAIRQVHSFSKGYPRLINIICDRALLTGYSKDVFTIDKGIIKECAAELDIPKYSANTAAPEDASTHKPSRLMPILAGFAVVAALILGLALSRLIDIPFFQRPPSSTSPAVKNSDSETKPPDVNPGEAPGQPLASSSGTEKTASRPLQPKPETKQRQNASNSAAGSEIVREKIIVQFGRNTERIPDQAARKLDRLIQTVKEHPESLIDIKGYTDSRGDYQYNMQLSLTRANMVKNYLVENGLTADAIETAGLGPQNPAASNDTPEGRRANRRVEIDLTFAQPAIRTESKANTVQ